MAVNGCLQKGVENDWGRLRKVSEVVEMFPTFIVVMVVTWGSQLLSTHQTVHLKWVHIILSNFHLSSGEKHFWGEQRYKQDGTESLLGRNKSLQQPGLC